MDVVVVAASRSIPLIHPFEKLDWPGITYELNVCGVASATRSIRLQHAKNKLVAKREKSIVRRLTENEMRFPEHANMHTRQPFARLLYSPNE